MSDPIIFYDLMRQGPEDWPDSERSWSPNTLKTRLALNIKGIPYTTEWLKFAEIAPKMQSLGLEPVQPGSIAYTLPTIVDPSSPSKAITESFAIAQYLDAANPSTPPLVPAGTAALQLAYIENVVNPLMRAAFAGLCRASFEKGCVDEADRAHYRITRETLFVGESLEEVMVMMEENMETACETFRETLDGIAKHAEAAGGEGVFIGGERPWHVDTAVAAVLLAIVKMCGREHALSSVILEHEWAHTFMKGIRKVGVEPDA
ncbi:hypothetical protein PENSPDRAFT_692199 [Peniophora sp. CONT]|nr:hypothetical protein PENSPDRAFT_692199 [Peniophora sp. CONT]